MNYHDPKGYVASWVIDKLNNEDILGKTSFVIKLSDNINKIIEDECQEYLIPKEDIKISVRYSSNYKDLETKLIVTKGEKKGWG